jgi:hypothetical protein
MSQYIVVDDKGKPLMKGDYDDAMNLLVHGDTVSVFNSYSTARDAIDRSRKYAEARGFPWRVDGFRIMRVVPWLQRQVNDAE